MHLWLSSSEDSGRLDLIHTLSFDETSEGRASCLGAYNDVGGEVCMAGKYPLGAARQLCKSSLRHVSNGTGVSKKKLVPDSHVVSALTHELSVSTELTLDPDSGRYTKSSNEDATRMESPSNLTCSARCLLHVSS